jgi:CheY-like chemotaxis protein
MSKIKPRLLAPSGKKADRKGCNKRISSVAAERSAALVDSALTMVKMILVVDDEPLTRAFIRDILEDDGCAVKEAANVHDALDLLDAGDIDAVLTDIEMPGGLNGLDLAKMIRAMWPNMPLIVVSGRMLPRPEELPPHTPVLTKPFSPERLLDLVHSTA